MGTGRAGPGRAGPLRFARPSPGPGPGPRRGRAGSAPPGTTLVPATGPEPALSTAPDGRARREWPGDGSKGRASAPRRTGPGQAPAGPCQGCAVPCPACAVSADRPPPNRARGDHTGHGRNCPFLGPGALSARSGVSVRPTGSGAAGPRRLQRLPQTHSGQGGRGVCVS